MNNSPTNQHQTGVSVKVQGLHKSFDGQEVLKGVNLEVNPGEIFVIMGTSERKREKRAAQAYYRPGGSPGRRNSY